MLLVAAADDTRRRRTVLRASRGARCRARARSTPPSRPGSSTVRGRAFALRHPLVALRDLPRRRRSRGGGRPTRRWRRASRATREADRRAWHRVRRRRGAGRRPCSPSSSTPPSGPAAGSAFAAASLAYERAAALTPGRRRSAGAGWWPPPRAPGSPAGSSGRCRCSSGPEPQRRIPILRGRPRPLAGPGRADGRRAGGRPGCSSARPPASPPLDGDRAVYLLNIASVAAASSATGTGVRSRSPTLVARPARSDEDPFDQMIRESLLGIGALSEGDFAAAGRRPSGRSLRARARDPRRRVSTREPSAHVFAAPRDALRR